MRTVPGRVVRWGLMPQRTRGTGGGCVIAQPCTECGPCSALFVQQTWDPLNGSGGKSPSLLLTLDQHRPYARPSSDYERITPGAKAPSVPPSHHKQLAVAPLRTPQTSTAPSGSDRP